MPTRFVRKSNPQVQKWIVEYLSDKLAGLPSVYQQDQNTCIYRVPKKLRRVNEEAYSPRLVSIGPLHRGSAHLQAMELFKVRCLESYIKFSGLDLEGAANWVESTQYDIKWYYQDKIEFSEKEIFAMILLDGVFILMLLLKNYLKTHPEHITLNRDEVDLMLDTKWMVNDLLHDLMLLENQLPYRCLYELFNYIKVNIELSNLTHEFFKYVGNTKRFQHQTSLQGPKHLLDYLLSIHIRGNTIAGPHNRVPLRSLEYPSSATVLQEAGVKFAVATQSGLLDIVFQNGVLKMPKLTVNEWTKAFFLNLIAFEQNAHRPALSSSYVIFMDSLINTSKDVDLLVKHDIIENFLGDTEQVSHMFNNLYKESATRDNYFHFSNISKELNDYSKDNWHQWKAAWFKWKLILKRDYFSNPWTIISVIGAIVLLGLTVTQTVCSVIAL